MNSQSFIAYTRVSTQRQSASSLGIGAQEKAITAFLRGAQGRLIGTYQETESGKCDDRPELVKALKHCRLTGATLLIAKLDRLSRNLPFIVNLMDSNIPFVCADMPEANEMTAHFMAVLAHHEGKAISQRTKEALAVAKARGVKLGNPNGAVPLRRASKGNKAALKVIKQKADARAADLADLIIDKRMQGLSYQSIADDLNEIEVSTARGGRWHGSTVRDMEKRLLV